jgi:Phosphohydrolase-associated domain
VFRPGVPEETQFTAKLILRDRPLSARRVAPGGPRRGAALISGPPAERELVCTQAETVVHDLFRRFTTDPAAMPEEWRAELKRADEGRLARRVADYIAGMTDNYALQEHRRLFAATPELR